ncbi:MAG: hypothetical protein WD990_09645 [Acidimicrobiia bacterium]
MNPIDFIGTARNAGTWRRTEDQTRTSGFAVIDVFAGDLPCPWCGGVTSEADASCRGCGRNFG